MLIFQTILAYIHGILLVLKGIVKPLGFSLELNRALRFQDTIILNRSDLSVLRGLKFKNQLGDLVISVTDDFLE